ncbi:hypothetical protein [Marichromatium gracile]|uniref:Uncharacterized protein n=1 Tax=Marichromatium gracile TaxID=1048 RepID=A0A4R4A7D6_MARGR|nr:hypothetical protein [Marichromatium gracile]TCW34574.1 hypothetical protein EDC29_110124 [Marichromatium gracile]
MPLWLSQPAMMLAPDSGRGRDARFDFYVENAAARHGTAPPVFAGLAECPDTDHPEAETLAGAAVRLALLDAPPGAVPTRLYDCRSSPSIGGPAPSYKLLAKASLDRTVPLALHGQGGTETIQAILLRLCEGTEEDGLTLLSGLHWPVGSERDTASHAASAAAAALISPFPPLAGGYRLLSAAVTRHPAEDRAAALATVLGEALERSGLAVGDIGWSVAQEGAADTPMVLSAVMPDARKMRRTMRRGIDLGCADLLVSLRELSVTLSAGTPGALLAAGNFMSAAALIVVPEWSIAEG